MIDKTKTANIDWPLIGLLILNSLIGFAFIYSSACYLPGSYPLKQLFWMGFSLAAMFLFLMVDYRMLAFYAIYIYAGFIVLLAGILVFGKVIAGTKSWIRLPFFQIQPSEFVKIIVILVLAQLFSKYKNHKINWRKGTAAVILVAVPVGLISLQPDLGTALSFLPILAAVFFLAGISRKVLVFILIAAVLGGFLTWNFGLQDYQKERLRTVIFPERDPLGSGYQIIQSKIAVGSGGLLGKGYMRGTQSQLRFLPARHTDFIFSVIGEEMGFAGVAAVLLIYFALLARIFSAVPQAGDRTGAYIVFMVAVMLTAQFFINVLMTIGLFPITGIPLPFLSYGGSSLLANYLAVSLVLNVKLRRFVNV